MAFLCVKNLSADDLKDVNGVLVGFSVLTCIRSQQLPSCTEIRVLVPSTSVDISNLPPWTWCDVSVAVVNHNFTGPFSNPVTVQTLPEGL